MKFSMEVQGGQYQNEIIQLNKTFILQLHMIYDKIQILKSNFLFNV